MSISARLDQLLLVGKVVLAMLLRIHPVETAIFRPLSIAEVTIWIQELNCLHFWGDGALTVT